MSFCTLAGAWQLLGLVCGLNGCWALAQAHGKAAAALLGAFYVDPETPSAVVVGAADYKMEKGVSNEVWGTCGASWTF